MHEGPGRSGGVGPSTRADAEAARTVQATSEWNVYRSTGPSGERKISHFRPQTLSP